MIGIVSQAVLEWMPIGKYTRWAVGRSTESLVTLLWTVGVFGRDYHAAWNAIGRAPEPAFAPHHMDESRMRKALVELATLWVGGGQEHEPQAGKAHFNGRYPAFSEPFCARLAEQDPILAWASRLTERQFWTLLWQADEYAVRVNSSWSEPDRGPYPPPRFDVAPSNERVLRGALSVLAGLCSGADMDLSRARSLVLEEARWSD